MRHFANLRNEQKLSLICLDYPLPVKSRDRSLVSPKLVVKESEHVTFIGSAASSLTPPTTSTSRSTAAARRHFRRAATHGRLLTQAELLKLGHFRRFLRSSGLSQLDFLLRIEHLRRYKEDEACQEVDEEGRPAFKTGSVHNHVKKDVGVLNYYINNFSQNLQNILYSPKHVSCF